MEPVLQKEIISHIYDTIRNINSNIYAFTKINNTNTDKKLLKKLIRRENVFSTIICPHEYKYISELKEIAQNMILFAPLTLQHDFANYNTYLNKLNKDEFIVYGAHTQNIPLIVELKELEESAIELENETKIQDESTNILSTHEPDKVDEVSDNDVTISISNNEENEKEEEEEKQETQLPIIEYPDVEITETEKNANNDTELISLDDNIEIVDEPEPQAITTEGTIPAVDTAPLTSDDNIITEDIISENYGDVSLEEPEIDYSLDETDVSGTFHEEVINQENNYDMVEQAAKDIDRAMYEKLPSDDENIIIEELPQTEHDELTEDDLNLIDNLAGEENIEISEPEPLIELSDEENPPVIPIYPAENIKNNNQTFEPGDKVSTAKYGEGVVEKMIKYGNKMLCSIEFPQIGRRLLDPNMTEITKLS